MATFRAEASAVWNNNSPSVTVPGTVVAGDRMLLRIDWGNATTDTIVSPSGWTQVGTDFVGGAMTSRLLKKTAVTADIGATFVATSTSTHKFCLGILAYSGSSGFGEVESTVESSASTSHIAPALTTMQPAGSLGINWWSERSTTNTSWSGPGTSRINQLGTGAAAVSTLATDSNTAITSRVAETATSGVSTTGINLSIEVLDSASVTAPGAPTSVTAVAGDGKAVVSFTPGATNGATNSYVATSSTGKTGSGSGSPITVAGLTNGTPVTFTVTATSTGGSTTSSASGSVTPAAASTSFKGWGIPLVAGVQVTPPPSTSVLIGITGSTQAAWNSGGGTAGLTLIRGYSSAGAGQPSTWASVDPGDIVGPTAWVASMLPDIASVNSGSLDSKIRAYAATVPNGAYLTIHHEPDQPSKNINPVPYAQALLRFQSLVQGVNATLKVGPIVMCYTSNSMPLGKSPYHVTLGHNEWLEGVANVGMVPDFVGLDGYPHSGTTKGEFSGPIAIAQGLFPTSEIVVPEIGFDAGASVAGELTNMYSYFSNIGGAGVTRVLYFNETGPNGNYVLTAAQLAVLGGLGL